MGGDIETLFQSAGEEIFLTLDRLKIFNETFANGQNIFSHTFWKKNVISDDAVADVSYFLRLESTTR